MSITRPVSQKKCAGIHKALLSLCLVALFATACGQRGPLYLPAQEPAADATTAETDEAEGEQDKGEQDEEEPRG